MADKARLKREYKNSSATAGVYRILNTVTGKAYLAGSLNLHGVLERDRFVLKMGSHMCRELQADFNMHGDSSFTFDVLETLPTNVDPSYDYGEDLEILEQIWLDKLQPYGEKGYNVQGKKIRRV